MDKRYETALQEMKPQPLTALPRYYNGFLYGEFGVGKTVWAAMCAQKKALLIYTDNGRNALFNHPEVLDKIDGVPYDGLSQLDAVGQAITEGMEPYSQYDLVIIDTISQIQEEYLDWLNENYKWAGNHRERATANRGTGLPELETIGLPDYKVTRDNMRKPIKSLIKAPVDVLFLAHLREPSAMEVNNGKLVRRPTLTEAVFKLIAREATFLALMERKGTERTIQFATDKKTVSKSQIKELDNQTLQADKALDILKKWKMN